MTLVKPYQVGYSSNAFTVKPVRLKCNRHLTDQSASSLYGGARRDSKHYRALLYKHKE